MVWNRQNISFVSHFFSLPYLVHINLQLKEKYTVGDGYLRFVRQNLNIKFLAYRNSLFGNACNVWPLLVSCEVRNELFSLKDKNSYET